MKPWLSCRSQLALPTDLATKLATLSLFPSLLTTTSQVEEVKRGDQKMGQVRGIDERERKLVASERTTTTLPRRVLVTFDCLEMEIVPPLVERGTRGSHLRKPPSIQSYRPIRR